MRFNRASAFVGTTLRILAVAGIVVWQSPPSTASACIYKWFVPCDTGNICTCDPNHGTSMIDCSPSDYCDWNTNNCGGEDGPCIP